jgi:hypothetical protein
MIGINMMNLGWCTKLVQNVDSQTIVKTKITDTLIVGLLLILSPHHHSWGFRVGNGSVAARISQWQTD